MATLYLCTGFILLSDKTIELVVFYSQAELLGGQLLLIRLGTRCTSGHCGSLVTPLVSLRVALESWGGVACPPVSVLFHWFMNNVASAYRSAE